MPKFERIGLGTKHSNTLTASGHETATISITKAQIQELLDLMATLRGEEAVDCAFLATEAPQDTFLQEEMLRSTLQFYSNVRFLCHQVKGLLVEKKYEQKKCK